MISAFNEERVIEDKIKNPLSLSYPKKLIEIVVVSDGSTVQTNQIVTKHADCGAKLIGNTQRIGKTACLNNTVPLAAGDIIVFSDANSKHDIYALRALVSHFIKNDIGFVTGWSQYLSEKNDSNNIR